MLCRMDLIDADAESGREKLRGESGEGIVGPILDAIFFEIPFADHGVVFERCAAEAMEMHAADFYYVRGLLKGFVDVAEFEDVVPDDVGAGFFVEDRGVGQAVFGGEDRRENIVIDFDELGGVFCGEARFGDYGGNGFALEADFIGGQRVVFDGLADAGADLDEGLGERGDFFAGEGAEDAFGGFGAGDIEARDARVGVGRAHQLHVNHAEEFLVVHEAALALHEASFFAALYRLADPFARSGVAVLAGRVGRAARRAGLDGFLLLHLRYLFEVRIVASNSKNADCSSAWADSG